MNAGLSGKAITLAVAVKQASVARAHRPGQLPAPGVVEVPDFETIAAARKKHLVSLLREARHAAVTALLAFIQHRPTHHVPRPHSTTAY